MRFLIEINSLEDLWHVTFTCPDAPNWKKPRFMRKVQDPRSGLFPQPLPENMPQSCSGLCTSSPKDIFLVHQSILKRQPNDRDVIDFGSYLFNSLIGKEIWEEILQTANQDRVIELALSWAQTESSLDRLNWEMMYGPNGFLAAGNPKEVAITRLVANTAEIAAQPLSVPPRVLFVVGTSLDDPYIRAGAEYLGLLRQLEKNGRRIHSRILQNATPSKLKEVMAEFRPEVVHFICHGGADENGGFLELKVEEPGRELDKLLKRRYGTQLLDYLRVDGKYPSIVVLGACHSAEAYSGKGQQDNLKKMLGVRENATLAISLINGGIPIVIGMAGRIADMACRLFTRRFGEALVQGESLIFATSQGRRAAFAEGPPPEKTVDWAFPAVFMAEGIAANYTPAPPQNNNVFDDPIQLRIKNFKVERLPVFCGRDEFFEAYYELFKPGSKPRVLAACVKQEEHGFGKTRLLQELTAQALRDGHVPCLICSERSDWDPPVTPASLGFEILKAIADTRRIFELKPPLESELLKRLLRKKPPTDLEELKQDYQDSPDLLFGQYISHFQKFYNCPELDEILNSHLVQEAIRGDLAKLITDARKKYSCIEQANGKALVLLDEVHRYDKALDFLLDHLLGNFGLGTQYEFAPVIITCQYGPAAEKLKLYESKPWLEKLPLEPFKDGEAILAYQTVMLHPFKRDMCPGFSDVKWVIKDQSPEEIAKCEKIFQILMEGKPQLFEQGMFYKAVKIAKMNNHLEQANDDQVLAREGGRL